MATKAEELKGGGCFAKAADDEPLFVLRAQDKFAPVLVEIWRTLVKEESDGETRKTHDAMLLAEEMREWQAKHGSKVPD